MCRPLHAFLFVQKIDKKLNFFQHFQYKYTVKEPENGTYMAHCMWSNVLAHRAPHAQTPCGTLVYTHFKMCKKLHFFWHFFRKKAYFLGNEHFLAKIWQIYGTYTDVCLCRKLQKIAKNWTFFDKKSLLRLFWALFAKIMGHIRDICAGPHELMLIPI